MEWTEKYDGEFLADGSYGEIYSIIDHDSLFPRPMVVKALKQDFRDAEDRQRIRREVHCLLELADSQFVINVVDYDSTANYPWFLMPKADTNLENYVVERGRVSDEECIYITRCVLNALEAAHERDILHRDLGASNVLLFDENEGYQIKVADFSLGRDFRRLSRQLTRTAQAHLGQDAFVAPEQIINLNDATKKSDIFAVGSLMAFMLTGRDPRYFTPDSPLAPIIQQLRERDPHRRPESVAEVLRILDLYHVIINRETRLELEEIIRQFEVSKRTSFEQGTLGEEAFHDLTLYMTKENQLFEGYNRGQITYSRYFYPIISMPNDFLTYWITRASQTDINHFLDRFFEQLNIISRQTGWTFRNMTNIVNVLMRVFSLNNEVKPRIFDELINVWRIGFGEAYQSVLNIMTSHYSDNRIVASLALIIIRNKDDLRDIYYDNVERIRHAAFAGIFEAE